MLDFTKYLWYIVTKLSGADLVRQRKTVKGGIRVKKFGKRLISFIMAMLMVSLLCVNAFAAQTSRRTIYGGNCARAVISTGKATSGWRYSTQVIVQNKGNRAIFVWSPSTAANVYTKGATVYPGSCRTFYVSGNYKTYYVNVQASGGTSKVQVVTSRGSAWWG